MTTRLALAALVLAAASAAHGAPSARGPDRNAPAPFAAMGGGPVPMTAVGGTGIDYEVTYLYNLSSSFGPLPLSNVQLSYDREHRELFVTGDGPVRVFNDSGMETFAFGDDPELGFVLSVASSEGGALVALSAHGGKMALVRCSFRGEFRGIIEPRGVPEAYAHLVPSILRYHAGKLYLADQAGMRVLVLDTEGNYVAGYDVAAKLNEAARRDDLGLRGFNVDPEGNILFTIQPLFTAYTMSPDGEIQAFGQRGSAPGKFNIVGGIARDDAGNYYVSDMLKSAVLVFDKDRVWRTEFGYRGSKPGNLTAPEDVVAVGDRVFVSQRARRGVSVFRVARQ